MGSLTITYFHTGIRTIIGVESFHGPVRDGKGWDRLAMVIRHLTGCRVATGAPQPIGKKRKEVSDWVVLFRAQHVISTVRVTPVLGQDTPVIGSSLTGN